MRHLTTIDGKPSAESFVAFLLTKDISTHVESNTDQSQWDVWIRDEDKLAAAQKEYALFQEDPSHSRYRDAIDHARVIVKEKRQKQMERQKNLQQPVARSGPDLFGGRMPPLTLTLIVLCVIIGFVSEFGLAKRQNWLGYQSLKQLKFVDLELYKQTGDPAASLKKGELWRVLTPAFLHGDILHLLLNMLSLASLGRITEKLEGIGKYAIILLLVAIGSHLFQGLMPIKWMGSPNFVGISGVVLGLLGYIGIKTTLRPDLGFKLAPQAYIMTAMILVLGFTGGLQDLRMANLAHLGGLATGALVGLAMSGSSRRSKP